jgi:hypothetical protein
MPAQDTIIPGGTGNCPAAEIPTATISLVNAANTVLGGQFPGLPASGKFRFGTRNALKVRRF